MNNIKPAKRRKVPTGSSAVQLMLAAAALVISPACAQQSTAPKYHVACEQPAVSVAASDLGVEHATFDRAGVQRLIAEPTRGQFPSGLCVARVEAFMTAADARRLRLLPLPSQHAIYWNHLLDGLPAVREIVLLREPGIDPRGCDRDEILEAAKSNACELCLIYARVDETDADAEYVGVLWNTRSRTPIATVRAPVVLPMDVAKKMKQAPDCDVQIGESDFRSEQDFRRLTRDLLWDLARQDLESATREESPWKNYIPPMPPMFDRYRYPNFERPAPYNSSGRDKREQSQGNPIDVDSQASDDVEPNSGAPREGSPRKDAQIAAEPNTRED